MSGTDTLLSAFFMRDELVLAIFHLSISQMCIVFFLFFLCTLCTVFTSLHGMQTRSSDENSVRPSVCPSVRHTHDKTVERSVQIYTPYKRTYSLVF